MSHEINRGNLLDVVFTLELITLFASILVAATQQELMTPSLAIAAFALLSLPITAIINANYRK